MNIKTPTLTDLDIAERTAEADVPLVMDEDAFRGFYDRTSRPLWRYLRRLTGDAHVADDLLQETYYRFLRADQAPEGDAHARHYLFRIATNLASDRYRRGRVRPVEVPPESHTAGSEASHTPRPEQRLDVLRAMQQLGHRERAMLLLAYVKGASHQEIAAVLDLERSSVKTLLFRARGKLARLLGTSEISQ